MTIRINLGSSPSLRARRMPAATDLLAAAALSVAGTLLLPTRASAQIDFTPETSYPSVVSAWSLDSGDINRDGAPDLAVAGFGDGQVAIHLNDGTGVLADTTIYSVDAYAAAGVVIADLNNDSWPDVATCSHDGNSASVLLNAGDGTLAPAVVYPVGRRAWNIEAADLNNDGWSDLVTANVLDQTVSVMMNEQDGTFAPAVDYATDQSPMDVALGDLNGDGWIDIAVGLYSYQRLNVLLNRGDGTFAPKVRYLVGSGTRGVSAIDLDGDADLDLVTANSLGADITVLTNTGDGTFGPIRSVPVGRSPYQVKPIDVDRDGDPDLAVADFVDRGVHVLRNHGNGHFASPAFFATSPDGGADDVTVADFDGLGGDDLATSNLSGNNCSVLLNLTPPPPVLTQGPILPGQNLTLTVDGVAPSEIVYFLYSLSGASPYTCAPQLGGLCLDLTMPIQIAGTAMADADGHASLTVPVPPSAPPGTPVWSQAAVVRGDLGEDSIKSNGIAAMVE